MLNFVYSYDGDCKHYCPPVFLPSVKLCECELQRFTSDIYNYEFTFNSSWPCCVGVNIKQTLKLYVLTRTLTKQSVVVQLNCCLNLIGIHAAILNIILCRNQSY